MPSFLIATTFLGLPCGSGSTHGVNPEMQLLLQAADAEVQAVFDGLAPEQRIDPATGRGNASFAEWSAITRSHVCWQANVPHHSAGAAIDIEAPANPRIATDERALAAYDRALQFMAPSAAAADVGPRRPGESTQSVWARFKAVSDALAGYLSFAVNAEPASVSRAPIDDADAISDEGVLETIPLAERLTEADAVARLERHLSSGDFQASHATWPNSSRAQYLCMLRDYEHVRIPMVIGCAGNASRTANPARGFLQLRSEIVTALCDQGLRWGACDLGRGANGSTGNGAMMHFDLADDGGYPEINSLLRFG